MRTTLLLLLFCISFTHANNNETQSKLNEVTIYLNGAEVVRTAKITLPIGTSEFIFINLSPNIQESSIQISGLKMATVLSINYGINYLDKKPNTKEIESLISKIELLKDKISLEDNIILGYKEELSLIQSNRRLGNETENVNLSKVKEFAAYYRQRLTELNNDIHTSEKSKKKYRKEIANIKKQLNELNVTEKLETGEIKVKLNSEVSSILNLTITYNVTDAGWYPIYDLKAEKINAPLNLSYKAHIYQNTGQDWNDVKVTLSTSDPNTNNLKPELNTKYLNFINRYSNYKSNRATKNYNYRYNPFVKTVSGIVVDESGLPLPGVNVIVKGTTNGTQTGFDGRYSIAIQSGNELTYSYVGLISETLPIHSTIMNINMEEDISALDEVIVTAQGISRKKSSLGYATTDISRVLSGKGSGVQIRGISSIKGAYTSEGDIIEDGITNIKFEIKKQYTISSNGDVTVIKIDEFTIPTNYSYFAAPIVNENVFLTAKFGNWEQYNLLPGEANVYFEGSYSGKTQINPQATTDSLTVSLGVDPNVIVKRNQINSFKSKSFIGTKRIIDKAYEIELKNNKQSNIALVLMDRIPISQNNEIKIDEIETGTANYDDKKGLIEWKINLSGNTSKKLKFSYVVKFPKHKRINL
ncbi:MAG: mucoidy inhibitor MuiA family protein [Flavobacteriaceae bacterium]|nr:mucoidy inhibitor MuiA family protein [Flavobacteriaceae bacterium]